MYVQYSLKSIVVYSIQVDYHACAPALVLKGFKYAVNRKNASGKIWIALAFVPIRFDS